MVNKQIALVKQNVLVSESQEFMDVLYKISPQERFAIEAMRGNMIIEKEI